VQVRRESLSSPFDFMAIVPNLIVPSISLAVKVNFVFDYGMGLLIADGNIQTFPIFMFRCCHGGSISNFAETHNLARHTFNFPAYPVIST
jgi:hypothetical protein